VLGTDDRIQHALTLSYRYLNRRDRTESEMRRYLDDQEIEPDTSQRTIETLIDQGYLDDVRFVRQYIADKRELERWGNDRVRRGLVSRGIDREQVEAALEEPAEGQSELDRALAVLSARFPSAPRDRRQRDRALGVLLRKGYDIELAVDALSVYARGAP
jgi:regulatory protein